MFVVDPPGTLLRAALLGFLVGMLLALAAITLIYGYARFTRPRIARGRVWAEWRRRPFVWAVSLGASLLAIVPVCDSLSRPLAMRDLYWVTRAPEVLLTTRLGGGSGYLLMLFAAALGAYLVKRRSERAPAVAPGSTA